MKQITFDVEGLSDEQVELARQFIDHMKKVGRKESAADKLKALLRKGTATEEQLSEKETECIAAEAVAWARGK